MTSAAEAQQLLQQGRVQEAEHAFAALLDQDPDNVQARIFMALVGLRTGDLTVAQSHIQQAVRVEPDNPMVLHQQGRIWEAAGRYEDAIVSQRAALKLAPNFHGARLFLGRALELAGHAPQAVVAYARAMTEAQKEGRWLDKASTPAAFQPFVEHAVLEVRRGRHAAIDQLLQPVVDVFGRDSMRRIEKALRVYLSEEKHSVADPRQHSTFFHFPDIPASPYLSRTMFPWIASIEDMAREIRGELSALLPSAQGRERVFASEAMEADYLRGLERAPTWNGYYFYRYGERRADNCDSCPRTAQILDALPLCRVRGHGPEVLFSVFTPGTHLLPHRGVTNTRVVAHLPLMVPDQCALVVGGEKHRWTEGKIVVFDDTYLHEAWNRSQEMRVVLIFDLWSPYLTDAEQAALQLLICNIGDFLHDVEAAD